MIDLTQIKQRLAAATPGPWGQDDHDNSHCMVTAGADPDGAYNYVACTGHSDNSEADAALIANAPTDLAALVAEVEVLRNRYDADDIDFDAEMRDLRARANQAEAEVERLRAEMDRAQRGVMVDDLKSAKREYIKAFLAAEDEDCFNCGVPVNAEHVAGCTLERCPYCHCQAVACGCDWDDDTVRVPWDGEYPGTKLARRKGWLRPDGGPDLNRAHMAVITGRETW